MHQHAADTPWSPPSAPKAQKPPRLDAFSSSPALTQRDPNAAQEDAVRAPERRERSKRVRGWNSTEMCLRGWGGKPPPRLFFSLSPLQPGIPPSTHSAALPAGWPSSFPRVQQETIVLVRFQVALRLRKRSVRKLPALPPPSILAGTAASNWWMKTVHKGGSGDERKKWKSSVQSPP